MAEQTWFSFMAEGFDVERASKRALPPSRLAGLLDGMLAAADGKPLARGAWWLYCYPVGEVACPLGAVVHERTGERAECVEDAVDILWADLLADQGDGLYLLHSELDPGESRRLDLLATRRAECWVELWDHPSRAEEWLAPDTTLTCTGGDPELRTLRSLASLHYGGCQAREADERTADSMNIASLVLQLDELAQVHHA